MISERMTVWVAMVTKETGGILTWEEVALKFLPSWITVSSSQHELVWWRWQGGIFISFSHACALLNKATFWISPLQRCMPTIKLVDETSTNRASVTDSMVRKPFIAVSNVTDFDGIRFIFLQVLFAQSYEESPFLLKILRITYSIVSSHTSMASFFRLILSHAFRAFSYRFLYSDANGFPLPRPGDVYGWTQSGFSYNKRTRSWSLRKRNRSMHTFLHLLVLRHTHSTPVRIIFSVSQPGS